MFSLLLTTWRIKRFSSTETVSTGKQPIA